MLNIGFLVFPMLVFWMMFITPLVSLSKGVEVRSQNSQILKPTPNFGFQYDQALLLTEKTAWKDKMKKIWKSHRIHGTAIVTYIYHQF